MKARGVAQHPAPRTTALLTERYVAHSVATAQAEQLCSKPPRSLARSTSGRDSAASLPLKPRGPAQLCFCGLFPAEAPPHSKTEAEHRRDLLALACLVLQETRSCSWRSISSLLQPSTLRAHPPFPVCPQQGQLRS